MKRNNTFLFLFFILLSSQLQGQSYSTLVDTTFYVNVKGTLENGRPVFTQFVIKNIDSLKHVISYKKDDFTCCIFNYAIFTTEPYIGSLEMSKYSHADMKEIIEFIKEIKKFNKGLKEIISFPNKHYEKLHLTVVKTISEFWKIPFDSSKVNNISESIKIYPECYKHQYYYKFKRIIYVIPCTKKEINYFKL